MRRTRVGLTVGLLCLASCAWASSSRRQDDEARWSAEAQRTIETVRTRMTKLAPPEDGLDLPWPAATWRWHLEHDLEIAVDDLEKGNPRHAVIAAKRAKQALAALEALERGE